MDNQEYTNSSQNNIALNKLIFRKNAQDVINQVGI